MENTPSKYVSREYTVPVQAANEMAERVGQDIINRYSEQSSKYLLEYSREKTKMFKTLKQISEKTIDFDIDNFKRERQRLLKPPPPPDILVPKKILQAVPANCVLDFGPGNTIMYYGGSKYKKGVISRNSVITHPHRRNFSRPRPFTAIPAQTRRPKSVPLNRSGRNTSLGIAGTSGRNSSLEMSPTSPRNTSLRILTSGFHRTDSFLESNNNLNCDAEPDIEYNNKNSNKWEMPNRSFRQLKKLYTYTEEEKPDLTAERFKMMKMRENAYFRFLEGKVKEFRV